MGCGQDPSSPGLSATSIDITLSLPHNLRTLSWKVKEWSPLGFRLRLLERRKTLETCPLAQALPLLMRNLVPLWRPLLVQGINRAEEGIGRPADLGCRQLATDCAGTDLLEPRFILT